VSTNEEQLLTDLWNLAGGTEDNQVNASHLLVLMAGVMSLDVPEVLRKPAEEEKLFYRSHGPIWMNINTGRIYFEEYSQI
jgi:hypothetical protein